MDPALSGMEREKEEERKGEGEGGKGRGRERGEEGKIALRATYLCCFTGEQVVKIPAPSNRDILSVFPLSVHRRCSLI